jgi:hypothetical protein
MSKIERGQRSRPTKSGMAAALYQGRLMIRRLAHGASSSSSAGGAARREKRMGVVPLSPEIIVAGAVGAVAIASARRLIRSTIEPQPEPH